MNKDGAEKHLLVWLFDVKGSAEFIRRAARHAPRREPQLVPGRLEQHVLTSHGPATLRTSTRWRGGRAEAHVGGGGPKRWAAICAPCASRPHAPHQTAAEPPPPQRAHSRGEHSVCKNPADKPEVWGALVPPPTAPSALLGCPHAPLICRGQMWGWMQDACRDRGAQGGGTVAGGVRDGWPCSL